MFRKLLLMLSITGAAMAQSSTTTTYTGTLADLAQQPITSGQVTFTLTPSTDSTLPGTGRFIPSTINCNINIDGTLSGFIAGAVSGPCVVTRNTAITPGGTAYRICIQANFSTPGSCWFDYATTATKDISTPVPTLSTGPTNYGGVPGPPIDFQGSWSSTTVYQTGQAAVYSNQLYISLTNPNLNNIPSSSPLSWSIVISPASLLAAPTNTQTLAQPANTSFNVTTTGTGQFQYNGIEVLKTTTGVTLAGTANQSVMLLNGLANAALYPGGDIGAKVNAAIVAITCGTVFIPAGTYTQTTQITKPACVSIKGQGSLSTVLNWTTAGTALVVADLSQSYAGTEVSDLTLNGPGSSSSTNGLFIGGDPAAALSPAAYWGNHQNFNRIRIQNFGIGINFGNNAFEIGFQQDTITNNGTGVTFAPSGVALNNSGESISFTASSIQNSSIQGIDLVGYSDFYFYGSRCDYNATCGTVGGAATVHFFGEHFEQGSGTILTLGATADPRLNVSIYGGQMLLTGATGTDAQMVDVVSSSIGSLTIDGTMVVPSHPTTNFVTWSSTNPTSILDLSRAYIISAFTNGLTSNCAFAGCSIKNAKYVVSSSASSVAANTCAVQDMGVPGVRAGDLVQSITKATQQPGLAVIGANFSTPDHVSIQFCNVTAATIFPTTGDTYTFLVHQ